jgi:hypothetical protein
LVETVTVIGILLGLLAAPWRRVLAAGLVTRTTLASVGISVSVKVTLWPFAKEAVTVITRRVVPPVSLPL